jgi:hypothetical protein
VAFLENHHKYQYKSHFDGKQGGKGENNLNDKEREMKKKTFKSVAFTFH